MIKDPSDIYVFRVTQKNEPSIILAAVDENQYELWHAAFKRAKLMHLNSPSIDEKPYLSLLGVVDDQADGDEDTVGYERPESVVSFLYIYKMNLHQTNWYKYYSVIEKPLSKFSLHIYLRLKRIPFILGKKFNFF